MCDQTPLNISNELAPCLDITALYGLLTKRRNTRRKLDFGGGEEEEIENSVTSFSHIDRLMADLNETEAKRAAEEYEFDINLGVPKPDAKRWEYSLGTADNTPDFYLRPPHRRQSPTHRAAFRPINVSPTSTNGSSESGRTPSQSLAIRYSLRYQSVLTSCSSSTAGVTQDNDTGFSRVSRELFPDEEETTMESGQALSTKQDSDISSKPLDSLQESDFYCEKKAQSSCDKELCSDLTTHLGGSPTHSITPPGSNIDESPAPSTSQIQTSPDSPKRKLEQTEIADFYRAKKKRLDSMSNDKGGE